ncbi:hypothetical protein [Pontibacter mangrovi]|uniref:Uncharacterized protein n=1 Tax=Pontibacter mangrovi TaxID=2589816 RepID=A0A501W3H4_9BACT|nr:hypothetical protein [Pontibacter mangrovi]TPE43312.1 hypothetical protein FJM65_14475 [Pontibacter mangrovi]
MNEDSLSTKDMLMDISSMRSKAMRLTENGKAYHVLLKDILARDLIKNDEARVPSLKELSAATGLQYGKIRKYVEEIYHDLVLDLEARSVFSFTKVRYEFLIRGFTKDKFITLEADQLPVVPRVGEQVSMPFFYAYMKTSRFFVEEIDHSFEEDSQIVRIWLTQGYYNSYWHYRKDKAKEEHELGLMDFFHLEEHELKKKLGVGKKMDDYLAKKFGLSK